MSDWKDELLRQRSEWIDFSQAVHEVEEELGVSKAEADALLCQALTEEKIGGYRYDPAEYPFGQAIWVKDLGGFASAANPIVIQPSGTDLIDGLASFSIITPFDLIRLYALTDQSGYYSG
jgi:hypothetical protein